MTPKRKQEIRERCEKATEGPWFIGGPNDSGLMSIEDGRYRGLHTIYAETHEANFIAHARTDIPDLLDEIERLEKELAESNLSEFQRVERNKKELRNKLYIDIEQE